MLAVAPLLLALGTHGALTVAALLVGSVLLSVQNAPGVALAQTLLPRNLGTALGLMNGRLNQIESLVTEAPTRAFEATIEVGDGRRNHIAPNFLLEHSEGR